MFATFVAANGVADTVRQSGPQNIRNVFEFKTDGGFKRVKFSQDDRRFLAHGSYEPVRVWQTNDYSPVKEIEIHGEEDEYIPKSINGAFFVPNSNRIFIGSPEGKAIFVDLDSDEKVLHDVSDIRSRMSGISRSGHMVAFGNDLFDMGKNSFFRPVVLSTQTGLLFTRDDKYLVTSAYRKGIYVTDTTTGLQKREWPVDSGCFFDSKVAGIDVSIDNDTVAAGFDNGKIILYSIGSGSRIDTFRHGRGSDPNVVFSPDGKLLASWSREKRSVFLWDVGKSERIGSRKYKNRLSCLKFFPKKNLTAIGTLGGELIVESFSGETLINKKVMEKRLRTSTFHLPKRLLFFAAVSAMSLHLNCGRLREYLRKTFVLLILFDGGTVAGGNEHLTLPNMDT